MKIRLSLKSIILFLCLFLLGVNYLLYNSLGIDVYKNTIRLLSITISLFYFIYYKRGKLNTISLILLLLSIIYFIFGNVESLNLFTFVLFANILSDRIDLATKEIFIVYSCLVVIMLLLLITKSAENYTYFGLEGRKRSTIGFNNPNVASLFYSMYIVIFILQFNNLKISHLLVGEILGYLIYYYTNSRTSFFVVSIFITLILIYKIICRFSRIRNIFLIAIVIVIDICYVLNILSMVFIDKFSAIDDLLSLRITHMNNSLSNVSMVNFLFGNTGVEIDNFYYVVFLSFGIFVYLIIMYLTNNVALKLFYTEEWKYLIFLLSISLMGLTESGAYRIEILTFILFWKLLLSNNDYSFKNTVGECNLLK